MSCSVQYRCDECGAEKREANHWFILREAKDCGQIYNRLEVRAFSDGGPDDRHICGQACLIKAVSRFTGELSEQVDQVKADSAAFDAAITGAGIIKEEMAR